LWGRVSLGVVDLVYVAAVVGGAGALAGLAVTPVILGLLRAWGAIRRRGALAAPWAGAAVGAVAGAYLAAAAWAEHHRAREAAAIFVASVVVGVVVVAALVRSARVHALLARTPLLAASCVSAALVGHGVVPAHVTAHAGVGQATLGFCAAFVVPPFARRLAAWPAAGRRVAAVVVALVLVEVAGTWGLAPAHRAVAAEADPWLGVVWRYGQRIADQDGDGAAVAFGGRDCAPWDPYVAPGRFEIAGNGRDDDCLRGDRSPGDRPVRHAEPHPPAMGAARSVLVIVVDALRPDRMGIYGYGRPTTPNVDRIFGQGAVFERAYAPGASTRDSVAAILTGRAVPETAFHYDDAVVLDPANLTLPRIAARAGFETFAVVPFVALNMLGSPDLGFAAEVVYDDQRRVTAPQVVRAVEARLAAVGQRPFFGWVHLYEPHEPYVRHRRYGRVSSDPYDQEVAAADAAVGRIVAALERNGRDRDTLVVLFGDHGEAFGEHGHRFHNAGVYEEDVRVPLLLAGPGVPGRRVTAPVSVAGLARLVVDVLGWTDPGTFTEGGLGPALAGTARDEPVLVAARTGLAGEWLGWIRGEAKVHFDRAFEQVRVFDLAADPAERVDLALKAPGRAAAWTDAAMATYDHRIAAATTAWFDARRRAKVPAGALPFDADLGDGTQIVAAHAERTRPPGTVRKLPARVLVRTFVRIDNVPRRWAGYAVRLERDGSVLGSVNGPVLRDRVAPRDFGRGAVVEDVRTFKVYVEDEDAHVVLEAGGRRLDLGAVADLPAARWTEPP
ncbi:MAG: hypothetical protein D6705_14930, partial [Deltaproteobacteria bacterium]